MRFWGKKREEPFRGEVTLYRGVFRTEEQRDGFAAYYALPGGIAGLLPQPEEEEGWRTFHEVVRGTLRRLAREYPMAAAAEGRLFPPEELTASRRRELYRRFAMEEPYGDGGLTWFVLRGGAEKFPRTVREAEERADAELYLDEEHLVLVIQTAPELPTGRIAEPLSAACQDAGWRLVCAEE